METREGPSALGNEVETMKNKLCELTDEEQTQISGGQMLNEQGLPALNTLEQCNRQKSAESRLSERISTGKKINRDKDDPASWAIGNRLEEQMRRLGQE